MNKIRLGMILLVVVLSFASGVLRYVDGKEYFWAILTGVWSMNYLLLLRRTEGRGGVISPRTEGATRESNKKY